jgi:hypothetical protein
LRDLDTAAYEKIIIMISNVVDYLIVSQNGEYPLYEHLLKSVD